MARDQGSVWSPLPEAGAPDGKTKTQFIVHSTGDNGKASATRKYFAGPTLNESTFIVGWGPDDPTLQIMDSTDIADANGSANSRGISVEVVGDGVGGYNAWQRSELIRLGRWARAQHPIAARIIPSEPESGFGWHIMFGAPGPWAKSAKVCPGKARINELKADIFPAIFAGKDKSEEDDLNAEQNDRLLRIEQALYGGMKYPLNNMHWLDRRNRPFTVFRSDPAQKSQVDQKPGDGTMVLAAPGYWLPIPSTGHFDLYVVRGLCGPTEEVVNVPPHEFDHFRALYLAPASGKVDSGELARELAALLPEQQAADLAKAVADEADRRERDGDPATGPVS